MSFVEPPQASLASPFQSKAQTGLIAYITANRAGSREKNRQGLDFNPCNVPSRWARPQVKETV
jgi:hypothetical protein